MMQTIRSGMTLDSVTIGPRAKAWEAANTIMSAPALLGRPSEPIELAAVIVAENNIKRLPVLEDDNVNSAFKTEFKKQLWGEPISASIDNGVVLLEGNVFDPREEAAARFGAENRTVVVHVIDEIQIIGEVGTGSSPQPGAFP